MSMLPLARTGPNIRAGIALSLLGLGVALLPNTSIANERERRMGDAFLTAFPFSALGSQWWAAEYDHPASWFQTAWREAAVDFDASGANILLEPANAENAKLPAKDGDDPESQPVLSDKNFVSGQIQRRRWYGYGRYEIVMRPAEGDGLISSFYVYTGSNFGDTHEEITVEFVGRDTSQVYLDRFRDGQALVEPVGVNLGDSGDDRPRLYAFDWSEDALTWYVDGQEVHKITDPAEIPKPPAKIFLDLRVAGQRQADFAGTAQEDASGQILVQCVSYMFPDEGSVQCSDLISGN